MIVNDRITAYINSLDMGNGELLDAIARGARQDGIPVIKKETESLLKTLVAARQPETILEVGTAVGYSALLMSRVMPEHCHITTIENMRNVSLLRGRILGEPDRRGESPS